MGDAPEPLVAPHCVRCAFREAPVVCNRCEANEYCSETHQRDDTQRHRKGQCKAVVEAREQLRAAQRALAPTFLATNGVGQRVANLYAVPETRAYMEAKAALVVELANVGSHSGYLNALEEASDALLLDEQDQLELRQPVAALLVLMGRFQDAYDVVRFWATCEDGGGDHESEDDDTTVAPCFRQHGAPMTEPLDVFKLSSTVSVLHLCALTFLKLMVSFGIQGALQKLASDDQTVRHDALEFLETNRLPTNQDTLTKLAKEMKRHAIEAYFMVQERDKMVWWPIYMPKMINPAVHRWLMAYADMFHWFPPALETVYACGTKPNVEVALAALLDP